MNNTDLIRTMKAYLTDLKAIAGGTAYKCPECGEIVNIETTCLYCGTAIETDAEPVTMYDYAENFFDVEYTIGADGDYRSGEVTLACGGPGIYATTAGGGEFIGVWGSDRETLPLSEAAANALDDYLSESYECIKAR